MKPITKKLHKQMEAYKKLKKNIHAMKHILNSIDD